MTKPILFLILILFIIGCNTRQERSDEWDRENVVKVKKEDSRYSDAAKLAQKNMPLFIKMWNSKKRDDYYFNISARYSEKNSAETMWFTVLSIDQDTFNTELNNVPINLKTIQLGDKVKIPKDSIKDWIVSKNNKVLAGNFANEDI